MGLNQPSDVILCIAVHSFLILVEIKRNVTGRDIQVARYLIPIFPSVILMLLFSIGIKKKIIKKYDVLFFFS